MHNPLFILYGNSHFLNRGCEAIARSTVSILTEEFGSCRIIHTPGRWFPHDEFSDIGPNAEHLIPPKRDRWSKNWFFYQLRKRIFRTGSEVFEPYLSEAAAALAVGGDAYSLDYGIPVQAFADNRIILRHRKPVIIWGASVGPFSKNQKFEKFAARELKKVTLICARESETVSYLKELGISENVRLMSDPAFVLEPRQIDISEGGLDIITKPCIGINLSLLIERYWKGEDSWFNCVLKNLKTVLERIDMPILFVPHVVVPGRGDQVFMKKIMEQLEPFSNRLVLLDTKYDCQEIKWVISHLTAFIGTRWHSVIAALSSQVPTISIAYSMKARGINKDIFGHLDWCVSFEKLRDNILYDTLANLLNSQSQVKKHLADVMPAYQQRAKNAAKYIREVVDWDKVG
jgi:colanic acid/amylovoran biosynthesis protein